MAGSHKEKRILVWGQGIWNNDNNNNNNNNNIIIDMAKRVMIG